MGYLLAAGIGNRQSLTERTAEQIPRPHSHPTEELCSNQSSASEWHVVDLRNFRKLERLRARLMSPFSRALTLFFLNPPLTRWAQ